MHRDIMARNTYQRITDSFYLWINTKNRQPTAGAETYAFAQQMLPLLDWKGPGEIVQRNMVFTNPQVYVLQQIVPTGIAGIAAGQIAAATLNQQITQMEQNMSSQSG